jgi:hypothetical protein
MRRALLVEVVLQLLAIELDQLLPRRNTIAEIGEHATNDAVDLRRHGDLVLGGQCADDLESPSNRVLANGICLDRPDRLFRPTGLFGAGICTSG